MKCRSGGIGRRAGFRCLWSQDRVGSSPISCIIFFLLLRMPELRIRLAVRHRMSLLFRLGSSSFFLLCNFFQHNRIFFCSYFLLPGRLHYVYMLLYTDKSVCYISANYILMFLDYITNPKIKNPTIEIPAPISTYGSCDPACSRLSIPAPFDARTVVSQ